MYELEILSNVIVYLHLLPLTMNHRKRNRAKTKIGGKLFLRKLIFTASKEWKYFFFVFRTFLVDAFIMEIVIDENEELKKNYC